MTDDVMMSVFMNRVNYQYTIFGDLTGGIHFNQDNLNWPLFYSNFLLFDFDQDKRRKA